MPDVGSIAQPGPLAYFLTWTTYGSWLPGDERGWVDGRGGTHVAAPARAAVARKSMKEHAVFFAGPQRVAVEQAVKARRGLWHREGLQPWRQRRPIGRARRPEGQRLQEVACVCGRGLLVFKRGALFVLSGPRRGRWHVSPLTDARAPLHN